MTEYDDWLHAQEDEVWDADMEDESAPPFPSDLPGWWWGDMDEPRDRLGRTADEAYDAWKDERMECE